MRHDVRLTLPPAIWALLLGAVVLAVVATGSPAAAPRPVEVKARDFYYVPREITVRAGEVVFAVKNEGSVEHDFAIQDGNRRTVARTDDIAPGDTEQLKVTLRPGTYAIVCLFSGHKEAGMSGTLRVQP